MTETQTAQAKWIELRDEILRTRSGEPDANDPPALRILDREDVIEAAVAADLSLLSLVLAANGADSIALLEAHILGLQRIGFDLFQSTHWATCSLQRVSECGAVRHDAAPCSLGFELTIVRLTPMGRKALILAHLLEGPGPDGDVDSRLLAPVEGAG